MVDFFRTLIQKWKQTSDYECTPKVELFDTHFVQFGQVLLRCIKDWLLSLNCEAV